VNEVLTYMAFCSVAAVYAVCLSVCAPSGSLRITLSVRPDLASGDALQGDGPGLETLAAMQEAATESAALQEAQPTAPKPKDVRPAPPSSEEQVNLLDEVREYAINYTRNLPDFICLEQTRRYVDPDGREAWRLEDVLTARLSYFDQKEDYKLVSQNGRAATDVSYAAVGGAFSMGDFGTDMRSIFDPASHATFAWKTWATLRGRRMLVFSYRVPLEFSKYTLAYEGERKGDVQRIKVGYRGWVFVDQELKRVMRITQEPLNIPPSFPIVQAEETLDYDFTKIGDREFFLPLEASLKMHSRGGVWTKNVKEFRLYRKFSADAAIKFDGQEPPPNDTTKEQPPQQQPQ